MLTVHTGITPVLLQPIGDGFVQKPVSHYEEQNAPTILEVKDLSIYSSVNNEYPRCRVVSVKTRDRKINFFWETVTLNRLYIPSHYSEFHFYTYY